MDIKWQEPTEGWGNDENHKVNWRDIIGYKRLLKGNCLIEKWKGGTKKVWNLGTGENAGTVEKSQADGSRGDLTHCVLSQHCQASVNDIPFNFSTKEASNFYPLQTLHSDHTVTKMVYKQASPWGSENRVESTNRELPGTSWDNLFIISWYWKIRENLLKFNVVKHNYTSMFYVNILIILHKSTRDLINIIILQI